MVIHSVYFWLDPKLTPIQRAEFESGLAALFRIDAVSSGRFGKPADTPKRTVTDHSFHYALLLEFESVEAHDAYQEDPGHKRFVAKFSPWFREVRVFDMRTEGKEL